MTEGNEGNEDEKEIIEQDRAGVESMVAFEVSGRDEIKSLYETLLAKGVPFHGPPKEYPWNAYCCYFNDPDGSLWEIYTWIGTGAEGYHEVHD